MGKGIIYSWKRGIKGIKHWTQGQILVGARYQLPLKAKFNSRVAHKFPAPFTNAGNIRLPLKRSSRMRLSFAKLPLFLQQVERKARKINN